MNSLLKALENNEAVQNILNGKSNLGNLSLSEEALLLASAYQKSPRSLFVIKNNTYTTQQLFERVRTLLEDDVLLFNVEESLRVEAVASSPENKANQMEVMAKLQTNHPYICIMNSVAAIRFMPSPTVFKQHCINLHKDDEIAYEQVKQLLFEAGYTHVNRVDQPLCYGARGGIIDVYSINYEHPIRIEFFDNFIESIRFFDIATQRTIEIIEQAQIIPATDILFTNDEIKEIVEHVNIDLPTQKKRLDKGMQLILEENVNQDLDAIANHYIEGKNYKYYAFLKETFTIGDYVKDATWIISSKEEVHSSIKRVQEETISYLQELFQEGISLYKFGVFEEFNKVLINHHVIEIGMFANFKHPVTSEIITLSLGDVNLERTIEEIITESHHRKVVLSLEESESKQIKKILDEKNMQYKTKQENEELEIGLQFIHKKLIEGFTCIKENISIYTSNELFHSTKIRTHYSNKFKEAEVLHDYQELNIGDYIVHNIHGVGKYLGIVNKEIDGMHKDFLHIAYKGDDVLLVPLEQFRLIRKFVSKEGASPKLNKLGSGEWEKTKRKVSEKIAELADRLVHLYANRDDNIGFAYQKDLPIQAEFEADFDYDLTIDQAKAVKEIKKDMEMPKPMDRLLCGDVGFGKTEVAARVAFKAVLDGKQVAFLCPTTILSLQHYKTFIQRFHNYPVNIAVINRFIKPSDQKQIIKGIKEGTIDILIGTHRLLSKDVKFKDLGFLVIDEEQRFGVEHKEKIKELKNSVDVLSLSATPIPRTLQMSLIGIRSLSQLDTPPMNRMPVQTYVIEKNFSMIKEIIQRELARSGQVFYLYNNVKEIYGVARKLREAMPEIKIGVAHGQMARDEIEDVMLQFTSNTYQVLLCTTIIETGIDIPNANTIIIEDADHFGLSQLYQIKGRVGRSDRLAYAYLMYSPKKQLSEIATKRLKSIKEFTQLGSGYKIAMRDLTIRGAGDMLGPQQAGFIDTVGIDMYIEMLNSAISEKKGIKVEVEEVLDKANVKVDAYIPSKFATEDYEKITLYQRIEKIKTKKELLLLNEEIQDNYGKLPKSVQLLFEKKRLDICINEKHIENFKELNKGIEVSFTETWSNSIDGVKLFEMMTTLSKDITIRFKDGKITMKMPKIKAWLPIVIEVIERTSKLGKE
ncbi:MAG: transcription-repair coupling factor [Longicatena sp.]